MVTDELAVRLEKLAGLRAANLEPYPSNPQRNHTNLQAIENFEALSSNNQTITVAGRLTALRGHGGSCFADLVDDSSKLQLHFKKDVVGEEAFSQLTNFAERGDIIEVSGTMFN